MARSLAIDFKGLVTAPGLYQRATASFLQAWNVYFEQHGVLRLRRGVSRQTGSTGGPIWAVATTRSLGSSLLVNYGTASAATGLRYGDGSSALTAITGTVTNQPDRRMKAAQSQRNIYLTSDEGVRRVDTSMSLAFAGMPRGLPIDRGQMTFATYTQLTGASGFLADGSSVAYRVTWHTKDQQGVELGGSPMGRLIVRNVTGTTGYAAGTSRTVTNRIRLPKLFGTTSTALTTSYFYRLWRSRTSSSEPDDEMYLVAEAFITSTDLTNGYVDVADSTTDAVLIASPPLNTNANDYLPPSAVLRKGILNADEPPPLARDVALYADCLFYAETTSRPYLSLTMLATPADGKTLTIGGTTYTFKTTPGASTDVQIVTGYASVSNNIEATALNLCNTINQYATNLYAFYISGPSQIAGQLYIEARDFTSFTATSNAAANCFRPVITSAQSSSQDVRNNTMAFSKPLRADAVPPVNLLTAGPNDARILRIIPYRDILFVFTDYGVYTVVGGDATEFRVAPFDLTLHLAAREAVVVCDDAVYAWCMEGIARFDQTGAAIISNPIENDVTQAVATAGLTTLGYAAFAVSYLSQHKVMFFYPQTSDYGLSTGTRMCPYAFVYDTRTTAWSKWRVDARYTPPGGGSWQLGYTCGVVRFSDDVLFLGDWNHTGVDAYLYKERRDYAATDYQDTYQDGTSASVTPYLQMNYQSPDAGGSMHFQHLDALWESDTLLTGRTPPTAALSAQFRTELSTGSLFLTPTNAGALRLRIPVSQGERRGNRLSAVLTRDVGTVEPWGLVGLVLTYGDESAERLLK